MAIVAMTRTMACSFLPLGVTRHLYETRVAATLFILHGEDHSNPFDHSLTFDMRELHMRPRIVAILCVDADPDRPEHGGARYDCPDKLIWRQLPELASKITSLRKDVLQRFGVKLRVTWFIRADSQIRQIHGDAAWCCREFRDLWNDLAQAGDELAWHPHAWRWSNPSRCWYNETVDTGYILESYDLGFEAFGTEFGRSPAASRVGINFHNDATMVKLDELGVKVDLSGYPGLRLYYGRPEVGSPIPEGFDWRRTLPEAYHPARDDYQRPAEDGSLSILEIPITTWRRTPSSFDFWKGLLPLKIYDGAGYVRPAFKGWFIPNVWGAPNRFRLGISQVLSRAKRKGIAHYASSMHPDDISEANFLKLRGNLEYLIKATKEEAVNLSIATASQAREDFTNYQFAANNSSTSSVQSPNF